MTYRQIADYVKQRQRLRHRAMTQPEDGWYPEAFFLRGAHLSHQVIPVEAFADRETKARLWDLFATLIRVGEVRVFAFTVVMFMLREDSPAGREMAEREARGESPTAGMPYFQDIDGSIEQLHVNVFDAERHEVWAAEIKRPQQGAPHLAPFALYGPDAMSGAMVDPIKAALR